MSLGHFINAMERTMNATFTQQDIDRFASATHFLEEDPHISLESYWKVHKALTKMGYRFSKEQLYESFEDTFYMEFGLEELADPVRCVAIKADGDQCTRLTTGSDWMCTQHRHMSMRKY
jgi:hypothetical protein